MIQINKPIQMLQFPRLGEDGNIFHFITTRHGGRSKGLYASMNLGEYGGDAPEDVAYNREVLCQSISLPTRQLFVANQVHESESLLLDTEFLSLSAEEQRTALQGIDALITAIPHTGIAVSTADCVPILLYAPDKKIVAAIHAGWRGTVLQIVLKTIQKMVNTFTCSPSLMRAGIGPSISKERFEVGEEVVDAFRMIGADLSRISNRNRHTGKSHIDLWEANRLQLIEAGLSAENIEVAGICTYTQSEDFFSARRLGIESGRMLSGILCKE
ncbi:peptidoglycan editing factor PgeF [Parabacteroides sp. 52]|nr:peptidoglycan editing factor PgeF [Parabacteroides sp. 52]